MLAIIAVTSGCASVGGFSSGPQHYRFTDAAGHDPLVLSSGATQVPITELPSVVVRGADNTFPMCLIYPLESFTVAELLPRCTVFRVIATRDFMHGMYDHALVLQDGIPFYLYSDDSTAQFLSRQQFQVRDAAAAKRLLLAFIDLRGYRLQEQVPQQLSDTPKAHDPAWRSRWGTKVQESEGQWNITCAVQLSDLDKDSVFAWCNVYTITVVQDGTINVRRGEVLNTGLSVH